MRLFGMIAIKALFSFFQHCNQSLPEDFYIYWPQCSSKKKENKAIVNIHKSDILATKLSLAKPNYKTKNAIKCIGRLLVPTKLEIMGSLHNYINPTESQL